jgi:3-isopropylmalate/(R)-2-methylmalate dehydratase large subunit
MGMTLTEKILAEKSGKRVVKPGELVEVDVDIVLAHEVTTPPAVRVLEEAGIDRVFDPDKIIVTPDHFVPNKDEQSAELAKRLRNWVRRHKLPHYYEVGRHGICHTMLLENGHLLPGMIVVCGDSHTCTHGVAGAFGWGVGSTELASAISTGKIWLEVPETILVNITGEPAPGVFSKDIILYVLSQIGFGGATDKAIEFRGPTIDGLEVEDRVTLTNMAVEAGGTVGIINPDQKLVSYLKDRTDANFEVMVSDTDAEYSNTFNFDITGLEPMVGVPPLPSNGKRVKDVGDVKIDQAVLGSCTNGRINDLRAAAAVLKGRRVAEYVRMIVIPATSKIWMQANKEGLLDIFMNAGATVSTPTFGPCLGGYMGVLAAGETAISTTNRNFVGRMGSPESSVYLASPASVAASAVTGKITDPREFSTEF